MKKLLFTLVLLSGLMTTNAVMAAPVTGVTTETNADISKIPLEDLKDMSVGEVEKMIGKELTLKEKVALKYTQHKLKKSSKGGDDFDPILIYVLCFFVPPLAVYLVYDIGNEFWVNILLTALCGLPGVIHAFIICSKQLK